MRCQILSVFTFVVVCVCSSVVMAEMRSLDPHVHGIGKLNFAIEGSQVYIELDVPGYDVLGFETISTDEQRAHLQEVLNKLKDSTLWGLSSKAKCALIESSAGVSGDSHEDTDYSRHAHHKDDHQHKEHKHKEHDKAHDDHGGGHLDIIASYLFDCENISKLKSISTDYFDTFENAQKLTVQGITTDGQVSETFTQNRFELSF